MVNTDTTNNNQEWPTPGWLMWLEISFWVWSLLTITALLWALGGTALTILQGGGWLTTLSQANGLGWAVLLLLVWLYWINRLVGVKASTTSKQSFLTYFDIPSRRLIWRALRLAASGREMLGTKHLLEALLSHKGVQISLVRLGLSHDTVRSAWEDAPDQNVRDVLAKAFERAVNEQSRITWNHLFQGVISGSEQFKRLLDDKKISVDEALAVAVWTRRDLGYQPPAVRHGLMHDLFSPKRNLNKTWTARPTPVLDRFSRNLTELAQVGWLTSAKVRETEVEEAVRSLSRSQENSVILVGEPGVGKTSIVGDLALRMIQGDIPALKDYKLISLDIGLMMGSKVGFQTLFSRAVNEAAGSGNTILFVGNLDQLGKARAAEGFDLSAILLGALESKSLQLIGTSDPLNYKKYIENNANLVALFSRVDVEELDTDKATLVLEDLSHQIESKQGVLITLSAVKSAVLMASKYIHTGKLPDTARELLDEAAVYASRAGQRMVLDSDIEAIISSKTNVPVGEINMAEKEKLVGLSEKIHTRFIGQNNAVESVVEALKRARLGVSASGKRPIGTFLFLGPTGVGKTELAKSLAWAYFGDETKMVRLDMSEYQTRESIHNLLGAPAVSGDVALAGGSFTEQIKKTPFAVVLLDEIEKAHKEVLDIFLQVLDEGRLTDSLGNTIDFTHTIIIATSNAQARFIQESVRSNMPYDEMQSQLSKLLIQESFRPEFINRFDGVAVFKPLTEDELIMIARIKLDKLTKRLKQDKDITLTVSDEAIKKLAKLGYDPAFGARPLERVIRDKVETKIANVLLESEAKEISITEQDI